MITRIVEQEYSISLKEFPITGIIGLRQVGKTTMAKFMALWRIFRACFVRKTSFCPDLVSQLCPKLCATRLTNAPSLSKGTYIAMEDLGLEKLYIITPSADTYPMANNIEVTHLRQFLAYLAA